MVAPVHGDYRRRQAEIPLIVLCRFPGPALLFLSEERHSDDARFIDALRKIYPKEVVSSEKEFADFQKIDSRVLKKQFGGKIKQDGVRIRLDTGLENVRLAWLEARPEKAGLPADPWLKETGYVEWHRRELDNLKALLVALERRQAVRDRAIDDLLGNNSAL